MAKVKFAQWSDEVAAEYREMFEQDIAELDLSDSVMKSYWREGYSPKEYVRDMADSCKQEIEDQSFDIRYDL